MFLLLAACAPDAGLKVYTSPPAASILTPTPGEDFWEYEPVTFSAKVSDNATAPSDLILVWSAGDSGAIEGEQTITGEIVTLHVEGGFAAGEWGVSLQVTDEDGEAAVAEVAFSVVQNLAPNVTLLSPLEGSAYGSGVAVPVSAFVTDADAASNEELVLSWSVEGGPAYPNTSGYADFSLSDLEVGSHEVSVTVTDAAGDTDSAIAHFTVSDSDVDGDGYSTDDCDDSDPNVHPDADETCDTVDNDCDGEIDEAGGTSWYADTDADSYGGASAVASCLQPVGYVAISGDCDDADAQVSPAAVEACNEVDDDCDGETDESGGSDWFLDGDGDGYGDGAAVAACDAPAGHVALDGDCDDADAEFHPGAAESCDDPTDYNCDGSTGYTDADGDGLPACEDCDDSRVLGDEECNGLDDDCDGEVDESSAVDASVWYVDRDADGYGATSTWTLACDLPSGYAAKSGDCDDSEDSVYPGAAETCDLEDEDCDGTVDNDAVDADTWYLDSDGDGYGTTPTVDACEEPAGYASLDGDCDDADTAYNPGATEVCDDPADYNCDGSTGYADADGDGLAACDDCDDTRPVDDETCNDLDDDCDGEVDEDDAVDASTWYADSDGDGYGDSASTQLACDEPSGYVEDADDCDDTDSAINPGATELCDESDVDEDCDGTADDDDAGGASGKSTWWPDGDGDGYSWADFYSTSRVDFCEDPGAGWTGSAGSIDCDDSDNAVHPYASEVCDGVDNNCDGDVDEGDATDASAWYADSDGDGYGDADLTQLACDEPSGYVADSDDCDDTDGAINPGATELCDESDVDEDCDGAADDDDAGGASGKSTWWPDDDGDGYSWADFYSTSRADFCEDPGAGWTGSAGSIDCDDTDENINPGATEDCATSADDDCDGDTNEFGATGCTTWYYDGDGDDYGSSTTTCYCNAPANYVAEAGDCDDSAVDTYPDAEEICDGADNDCDGTEDEAGDGSLDFDGSDDEAAVGDLDHLDGATAFTFEAWVYPEGVDVDAPVFAKESSGNQQFWFGVYYGGFGVLIGGSSGWDLYDREDATVEAGRWTHIASTWDGTTVRHYRDGVEVASSSYSGSIPSGSGSLKLGENSDFGNLHFEGLLREVRIWELARSEEELREGAYSLSDTTGLVARWALDEGSGQSAADSSGNGLDATLGGSSSVESSDPTWSTEAGARDLEWCDSEDNDCDGEVDEDDAVDASTWYADADGDGYGDADTPQSACAEPAGYVANADDCDDTDDGVYPGATELCDNGVDDDCDGDIDFGGGGADGLWMVYSDSGSTSGGAAGPNLADFPLTYVGTVADGTTLYSTATAKRAYVLYGLRTWVCADLSMTWSVEISGDDDVSLYVDDGYVVGREGSGTGWVAGTVTVDAGWHEVEAIIADVGGRAEFYIDPAPSSVFAAVSSTEP